MPIGAAVQAVQRLGRGSNHYAAATAWLEEGKRHAMGNLSAKPEIIAAGGLAVCFFLPWAQIFGFGVSGYNLAQLGSYGNWAWVILISSIITILVFATDNEPWMARLIAGVTGALPIGGVIYAANNLGRDVFQVLAIGVYLGVLCGAALLLLALFNDGATARSQSAPRPAAIITRPYRKGDEVIHHAQFGRGVIKDIGANGLAKVFFYQHNAEYEVPLRDVRGVFD